MVEKIDSVMHEGVLSKGFGLIPKMVVRDKDLSIEAKAIYGYLAAFAGNNQEAFPGVQLICSELNISKKRYLNHRQSLVDKGYIEIIRKRLEKGFSKNIYLLKQDIPYGVDSLPYKTLPNQNVELSSVTLQNDSTNINSININSINKNNINNKNNNNNQPDMDFAKIVDFYEKNISIVRPIIGEKLGGLVDDFSADLVLFALEITAANPKVTNPISYSTSILKSWQTNLIANRQQAEFYESKKRGGIHESNQPTGTAKVGNVDLGF